MGWTRTGIFTLLTLAAATLPVSGEVAPAPKTAADQAPIPVSSGCPDQPSPPQPDERSPAGTAPQDGRLLIQAASQIDCGRSASARPLGNSGPQPLAAADPAVAAAWKPSAGTSHDLQSHAARVHEHAREWLTCRYPNAPPAAR